MGNLNSPPPDPHYNEAHVWQMPAKTAHFQTGTFQTLYDIDFKSKVVSFNEENLKMILDLNPIRHRGYLALFYPI